TFNPARRGMPSTSGEADRHLSARRRARARRPSAQRFHQRGYLGSRPCLPLTFISTVPMLHRHGAYTNPQGLVVMKKPVGVTDAELAVLKALWARGALSARSITQAVYPDGAESEFAAVHSFLQRLERKGLVARDRSSFVHIFSPTASPADVLGQELE